MPRPEFRPFEWSAPTDRLPLTIDRLGAVFNQLLETSEFPALQLPAQPEAAPTLPNVPPLAVLADHSVLQLEDGLAQRRLLAPLELKSWQNPDILATSVVRVGVDAGGRPVSVTLLSSSGSAAADQFALDQAWAARFEPLSRKPGRGRPQTDRAIELGQDGLPVAHRPDAARERPGGQPLSTRIVTGEIRSMSYRSYIRSKSGRVGCRYSSCNSLTVQPY